MSKYVFLLSGVAISCESKKQTIVVFSSIELEYIYVILIVKNHVVSSIIQCFRIFAIESLTTSL
jgi:hypothetical protein